MFRIRCIAILVAALTASQVLSLSTAHATPPWANGSITFSDGIQPDKTYNFNAGGGLGSNVIRFHVLSSPSGLAHANGSGMSMNMKDSNGNPILSWQGEFWLAGGGYVNNLPQIPRPLDTFNNLECSDAPSGNADIIPYLLLPFTGSPGQPSVYPAFAGSGQGKLYAIVDGVYFAFATIDSMRSTDADADGDTDGDDTNLMSAAFLTQDKWFDFDWNNTVDTLDLKIMLAEVNRSVGVGHEYCLDGGLTSEGVRSSYDPLTMYHADTAWPTTPACFRAGRSGLSHTLTWVAGGEDGATGRATAYDLRVSTNPITTAALFNAATRVGSLPIPATAGIAQSCGFAAPDSGQRYFAMMALDDYMHASAFVSTASTKIPSDNTAPSVVTNLTATKSGIGNVRLQWTAKGDDGTLGTATQYDLRWSASPIGAGSFAAATPISMTCPQPSGYTESIIFSGSSCTTYYFAVKSKDEALWSGVSNSPGVTTNCGARSQPVTPEDPTQQELRLQLIPRTGSDLVFEISGGSTPQSEALFSINDVLGRRVFERTLPRLAGSNQQVTWSLENLRGGPVGPGVYFARIRVGADSRLLKVLVVR